MSLSYARQTLTKKFCKSLNEKPQYISIRSIYNIHMYVKTREKLVPRYMEYLVPLSNITC